MKLLGVEAARGVAAILVVLLHASGMLSDPMDYGVLAFGGVFSFGRAGVDFFFVLSGFIITYVHAGDVGRPHVLGSFCRKRLLRIYPAYWAALAILGAILVVSPTPGRLEQNPWHIFASIFLLPEPPEPILGVGWSLRHELIFYALFGLAIVNRRIGIAVLGVWGAVILLNLSWATVMGRPYFSGAAGGSFFRVFNIEFFFGIGVALAVRWWRPLLPWLFLIAGILLFLANGLFESFGPKIQHEWPPRHLVYGLSSAMTLYGLAILDRACMLRVPKFMVVLGSASYSIYLMHVTVLILMQQVLRSVRTFVDIPLELAYPMLVIGAVIAGVAFSFVVERPMLKAGNRWFVAARQPG